MIRAVILAATIATLLCMWIDRPKPVQAVEVKYCPIAEWRWIEIAGNRVKLWYDTFGPCVLMDRYEYI